MKELHKIRKENVELKTEFTDMQLKLTKQVEVEKTAEREVKTNYDQILVKNKYLSNENEILKRQTANHTKETSKIKVDRDDYKRHMILNADKIKLIEEKLAKQEDHHQQQIRRYDDMLNLAQNDERTRLRSERTRYSDLQK